MDEIKATETGSAERRAEFWYLPASLGMLLASVVILFAFPRYFFPSAAVEKERQSRLAAIREAFSEARWDDVLTETREFFSRWGDSEEIGEVYYYFGIAELTLGGKNNRTALEGAYDALRRAEIRSLEGRHRRNLCEILCFLAHKLDRPAEEKINVYRKAIDFYPELGPKYRYRLARAHMERVPPMYSRALNVLRTHLRDPKLSALERSKSLLLQTNLYIQLKDLEKAQESLEQMLKTVPDALWRKKGTFLLGKLADRAGDREKAAGFFKRLIRMEPPDVELDNCGSFFLARYDSADGKLDAAEKRLNAILKEKISGRLRAAAMVELVEISMARKDMEGARDRFFALLGAVDKRDLKANDLVPPERVRAIFDRIVIYYRDERKYEQLHRITDRSLKADFLRLEDAYLTKGLIFMRQGRDYVAASDRLAAEGKKTEAAKALERSREVFAQAAAAFDKLITEDVGRQYYCQGLFNGGKARYHAGLYRAAIPLLQKYVSITDRKGLVEARYLLGRCHQLLGDFAQAIALYDVNISKHPNHTFTYDSRYEKGICLMSLGRNAEAVKVFMGLVDDPERGFLRTAALWKRSALKLAEALYKAADYANAWLWLENTITWYPDNPQVVPFTFYLARSLMETAREQSSKRNELVNRAVFYFRRVTELAAQKPKYNQLALASYFYIGDAYTLAGDYSAAAQAYNRAINRYPDTVDSVRGMVKMANCYYFLGRLERAAATYERAEWSYRKYSGGKEILDEPWVELAIWRKTAQRLSPVERGTNE